MSTLEERIENPSVARSGIWDFLVSAYSSSKAIKIGLTLIGQGYSYVSALLASGIFYLSSKTLGIAAKNIAQFITHPVKYLNNFKLTKKVAETMEFYNPFGKYRRPTLMGGTLSSVTYFTGF